MLLDRRRLIRWLALTFVLLSGATLRIAYNAHTVPDGLIKGDAKSYLLYAHNILAHSTYSKDRRSPPTPDSYWAPGYPVFLASILTLSGTHKVDEAGFLLFGKEAFNSILAAQVVLGVATIFLCFVLAASFLPGYWPLLPTFLVAISPHLVSTGYYMLTETLFGFTLLLTICLAIKAVKGGHSWWLLAGFSGATSYLVNPVSLLLLPMLAPVLIYWACWNSEDHRKRECLSKLCLLIIPVLVTAAAWTVRNNISVPGDQLSAGDRLLTNLSIGMYPEYHEKWKAYIQYPELEIEVPGSEIKTYGQFFLELSKKFSQEPARLLSWYTLEKPLLFLSWNIVVGEGDIYVYSVVRSLYDTSNLAIVSYSFMRSLHIWVVIGGLLGLFYLFIDHKENRVEPLILYLSVFYVSAVYILTQSEPRYSIPLRPELYLCATYFFWRTSTLLKEMRRKGKLD
jgi:4-amino-4-deoxy-L-arabinose transferase-like glycosyltransferase